MSLFCWFEHEDEAFSWDEPQGRVCSASDRAGFRFSGLHVASVRDVSAPCRRHLTGLASRLELVASTVERFDQR